MNSPSEDISDILIDQISGYVLGTNLFINGLPTKPDNCINITDNPSSTPMRSLTPTDAMYIDSVQFIARNREYAEAYSELISIRVALQALHHVEYNGTSYQSFTVASGPALLMWDNNNRAEIVMNINVIRKEA